MLDNWNLHDAEKCGVLAISALSDLDVMQDQQTLPENDATLIRVKKLLEIHALLRTLFPSDTDLAYRWISTKNEAFGRAPLQVIIENNVGDVGVDRVILYLKSYCFLK